MIQQPWSEEEFRAEVARAQTPAALTQVLEHDLYASEGYLGQGKRYREVLSSTRHAGPELLEHVWEWSKSELSSLLRNPHLDAGTRNALFSRIREHLRARVGSLSHRPHFDPILACLRQCYRQGELDLTHEISGDLFRYLKHLERLQRSHPRAGSSAKEEQGRARDAHEVAQALLGSPQLEEAVLHRLLAVQGERVETELLEHLAVHPQAGRSLWQALREKVRRPQDLDDLRQVLVQVPELRQDPEFRSFLEEGKNKLAVRFGLALDAPPETREHFLAIRDRLPQMALDLLQHPQFRGSSCLKRGDFLPLLSHPEAELRLRALVAVADWERKRSGELRAAPPERWRESFREVSLPF